jgi:RHS repeat-associated protein
MRGSRLSVLAMLAGAALVGVEVVPAWGEERRDGREPGEVSLGGLTLGDGLEGLIDEGDGSLSVEVPIGSVTLRWDSRALGADLTEGLAGGWGVGLGGLDTRGGLRVRPGVASDQPFEVASSWPSGLLGYDRGDVWFGVLPAGGVLAARGDGVVGERAAFAELRELGGTVTTFGSSGEPLARTMPAGQRVDWVWGDARAGRRLERVVDAEGVVTALDWASERGALVVRPAVNVPTAAGDVEGAPERRWRVEVDDGLVRSVTDASGARTEFGYANGLLASMTAPSGATTQVEWQWSADGVARVASLRTVGPSGEFGMRRWSVLGGGSVTGWPGGAGSGYTAELTDGATVVRSRYDGDRRLRERTVQVRTVAGMREVQAQRFDYPDDAGRPRGSDPLRTASQPARTEVVYRDAAGATRVSAASLAYDGFGRVVRSTAADGTVTERRFDGTAGAADRPAIGLQVFERVTVADGLVTERIVELNDARTAVTRSEAWSGRLGAPLTRVEVTEFDVEPDGFVAEERRFPGGDGAAEPVVVRRERVKDLARGTLTTIETLAPGTPLSTSSSQTVSLVHGGVVGTTDATGRQTAVVYDVLGRPVTAVDEAGRVTSTRYEHAQQHGRNATTVTGPDRVATTEERDAFGRVVRITDNIDHGSAVAGHVRVAETRDYPEPGVVAVTDAWGATSVTEQDVFGRVIRSTGPTGIAQVTDYDDVAGTLSTGVTATGSLGDAELVTTQRRDETARTVQTSGVRADGVPVPGTFTGFDGLGRETWNFDGVRRLQTEYDARGNATTTKLTTATSADSGGVDAGGVLLTGQRRFDPLGQVLEKTLDDGITARSGGARTTDALGRTVTETDQDGRVTSYEYTPDGLVERVVESTGRVTTVEYDADTRLPTLARIEAPGRRTVTTATEYDRATGAITAVYDPTDPSNTRIRTTTDAFGNERTVTYPDGSTLSTEYDAHGRVLATTDVAGRTSVHGYDDAGRLVAVTQHRGDERSPILAGVEYSYDELDRVTELRRDTGATTAYTYTSVNAIASETTTRPDGTTLSAREYTYDPAGQLTSRIDRVRPHDNGGGGELQAQLTEYAYDSLGRLTISTVHDGESADAPVTRRTEYELTVAGDVRTERVTTDRGTSVREFGYSPTGELEAITTDGIVRAQQYDDAGNLTRDVDGTGYAYDAANRLTAKTPATTPATTIDYWPDGSRRHLTDATGTTEYLWAGGELVNERRGERTTSYLLGAGRHARTVADSGSTEHYVADRHGSVTELIDARAEIATAYSYSDYGVVTADRRANEGAEPNPFQYAGELTDRDGSQPLGRRVYQPKLMRFGSPDDAPQHSVYGFADANPITRIDPTGRTATTDATPWVIMALSIAVSVAAAVAQLATMGSAGAIVGTVGALIIDIGSTVALEVNNHVEFMPASVAVTVGFAAIAAGMIFGTMMKGAGGAAKQAADGAVELQDLAPVFRRKRQVEKLVDPRAMDPAGIRNHGWHPQDVRVDSFIQQRNLDRHDTIMNAMEGEWQRIAEFDLSTRPDRAAWIPTPMWYDWSEWVLNVWQHAALIRQATLRSHYHHTFAYFRLVSKHGGLWGWMNNLLPADVVEVIRHYTLTYTSRRSGLVTTLRDARPHADAMLARFDRDFIGYHHLLPSRDHEFIETMVDRVSKALITLGDTGHKIRALSTHVYR